MAQKTIRPTIHAIDRFEQRVLPHLPAIVHRKMKKKNWIKQSLYGLVRQTEFIEEGEQMLHLQTFFTFRGYAPIPLTLVIDPVNRTLCTLYISPGRQNVGCEENPNCRVSSGGAHQWYIKTIFKLDASGTLSYSKERCIGRRTKKIDEPMLQQNAKISMWGSPVETCL